MVVLWHRVITKQKWKINKKNSPSTNLQLITLQLKGNPSEQEEKCLPEFKFESWSTSIHESTNFSATHAFVTLLDESELFGE